MRGCILHSIKKFSRYQNPNWILVKSTFSGFRVTAAGATAPVPPPPEKSVLELPGPLFLTGSLYSYKQLHIK